MYWHGPQLGYASRLDMLRKEFAGRCAYCGQPGTLHEVEHLLPRSAFPFDSYFNLLPACQGCNARKGSRTALEAGLAVHDDAYQAYGAYVRKRRPPHVYHTVKKGLLNLLRKPATAGQAERRLAMLANDLVTMTATQRSPRPLARYLATQLETATGSRPEIAYRSGRHTALYRSVALPRYDKEEQQAEGDLRNHAVDAILLGCHFPSASALENKDCRLSERAIADWFDEVRKAAPPLLTDSALPRVEHAAFLSYFEEDLGEGYCRIDLAAFNWNRARKATHQLDPFGQTRDGRPLKRVPAADVLKDLKDEKQRAKQIELIAHPGLRHALAAEPQRAAERLVEWLQQTVRAGLAQGGMSEHPADVARRQLLERFAGAAVGQVLSGDEAIPPTVGVRCLNTGSKNKLDVVRVDRDGRSFQRYQSQPRYREWYVGYRLRQGQVDRSKPVVLRVTQAYEVLAKDGRAPAGVTADSPLRGRPHGSREPLRAYLVRWQEAFRTLCEREGLVEVFRLTQGCVIERGDGTRFQLRNFDQRKPWLSGEALRDIRRVQRSPLQV
jgi:hypothetical protein